jgi:cytochrome c biogenesis protein CcdA
VLSLAIAVVAIALPDCINPSLIGTEVFFADGPHPVRRTAAFAFAAVTVTFLIGLALALGLGDLILSVVPKPSATVKYALVLAAGILLVVSAAVLWMRRRTLASSAPAHRQETHARGSPVLIGSGIAALEVLTAFPYFAAIALIVGSSESGPGKLFLLALYCAVYAAPLFAIVILCAVLGTRAQAMLASVVAWVETRWPAIVAPGAAIIGIGLSTYGVVKLS